MKTNSFIVIISLLVVACGSNNNQTQLTKLKEQRQTIDDFAIKITGEREPGKEPSLWATAKIVFILKGAIDKEKAARACELSMNKYCSVAETLKLSGTALTWEVVVN